MNFNNSDQGVENHVDDGDHGVVAIDDVDHVDSVLSRHIGRRSGSGGERTDYECLICQKYCKSRDECANHIEVDTGCP